MDELSSKSGKDVVESSLIYGRDVVKSRSLSSKTVVKPSLLSGNDVVKTSSNELATLIRVLNSYGNALRLKQGTQNMSSQSEQAKSAPLPKNTSKKEKGVHEMPEQTRRSKNNTNSTWIRKNHVKLTFCPVVKRPQNDDVMTVYQ